LIGSFPAALLLCFWGRCWPRHYGAGTARAFESWNIVPDLPPGFGDRIQFQQMIFNLLINAVEAMESVADRPRELAIRSGRHGVDKSSGMGAGLPICHSILEAHKERLSSSRNERHGATFRFVLPVREEDTA
jgi:signal transduction histidine kinase